MFKLILLLLMITIIVYVEKPKQLEAKKYGYMPIVIDNWHACKCKEHWGHWDDWNHWGHQQLNCKCKKKKKKHGFFKKLKKKFKKKKKKKKKIMPIVIPGKRDLDEGERFFFVLHYRKFQNNLLIIKLNFFVFSLHLKFMFTNIIGGVIIIIKKRNITIGGKANTDKKRMIKLIC